ncbi:MAG: PAS domain-containing protein [Microcoleus vaginatus WJT46-NPBG5]|nr:PAS domain-containing protein [Microcoleus vaginatus WJT46-NPBG5]
MISISLKLTPISHAGEILLSTYDPSLVALPANSVFLGATVCIIVIIVLVVTLLTSQLNRHLSTQQQALFLLQTFVNEMQVGVLLLSPQLEVQFANLAAAELLGLSQGELRSQIPFDSGWQVFQKDGTPFASELQPVRQALITKVPMRNVVLGIQRNKVLKQECKKQQKADFNRAFSTADTSMIWLQVNANPLLAANGEVERVICSFSDISERLHSETELQKTQVFLNSVIDNLPDCVLIKEAEFLRLTGWNQACEKLFGYSKAEAIGKNDYDFFSKDQADFFISRDREVLANGQLVDIPVEPVHTPHQGVKLLHTKKVPILDDAGIPQYLLAIFEDITERKQAENDLIKQHQRAQLLAEITLKIRQSLQLEEILQTTVTEVLNLLETDRVLIYRLLPDNSGTVVTEAVRSGFQAILGQNISDPCFGEKYLQLYAAGRVRAIADLENSDLLQCHIDLLQRVEVKANLVVPILVNEELNTKNEEKVVNSNGARLNSRLWGLLIAHQCGETRQWTSFEIELLQQLADQVSIALFQAQIREQETRQRQQLAKQNLALEQALKNLQQAQTQLVQSEKMVSLGQLVAGVAHEINNPVNFIYANVSPARDHVKNLLYLLELYAKNYPKPVAEITEAAGEIELEFLQEDLPKILSSMHVGADRIRQIVLSLRNFSRLDQSEKKRVDLHEGIDSTLLILQHRLKAAPEHPSIQIVKDYGVLPPVECYPGQLNQVFMNILSNCLDALENQPAPRVITIRTKLIESASWIAKKEDKNSMLDSQYFVRVSIADNGPGMTEEIRSRLFDPFFTTKPPGKGTGLGLSISYQIIVEKHSGQLGCVSEPDRGAEFIIEIPVKLPAWKKG